MGHTFLSDSWFSEVDKLSAAANVEVPAAIKDLVINVEVTGTPDGSVEARMEAGALEKGYDASAPTKLIIPFDVARKMMVDGDNAAAMQAFMSGQIKVEGDMSKIMAMQGGGAPSEASKKLAEQIRAMTD